MAGFKNIIARLRAEERRVAKQLRGIRMAIESLEFGTGAGASAGPAQMVRKIRTVRSVRRKRKFSAATRRKMALAQKARWARRNAKA